MKAQLLVLTKDGISVSVFDTGKITIGRSSSNTLKVNDRFVSRKHFVIEKTGERYYLTDLGTRNKTILNGQELNPRQTICLDDKSKIKVGDSLIEFTLIPDSEGIKEPEPVLASLPVSEVSNNVLVKRTLPGRIISGCYDKIKQINSVAILRRNAPPRETTIFTPFLWVIAGVVVTGASLVFITYPPVPKTQNQNIFIPPQMPVLNTDNRVNNPPQQDEAAKQGQGPLLPLLGNDADSSGPNYLYPKEEKPPEPSVEDNASIAPEPGANKPSEQAKDVTVNNTSPEITINMKDGSEIKARFLGYQDHRYIIQIEGEISPTLILDEEIKKVSFSNK